VLGRRAGKKGTDGVGTRALCALLVGVVERCARPAAVRFFRSLWLRFFLRRVPGLALSVNREPGGSPATLGAGEEEGMRYGRCQDYKHPFFPFLLFGELLALFFQTSVRVSA
jgi:hypothetical protein